MGLPFIGYELAVAHDETRSSSAAWGLLDAVTGNGCGWEDMLATATVQSYFHVDVLPPVDVHDFIHIFLIIHGDWQSCHGTLRRCHPGGESCRPRGVISNRFWDMLLSGVSRPGGRIELFCARELEMHCWGENPVVTAKLQLNGQDRFSEREGTYFDLLQPYQHHTRSPDTGINVYSFALRPEEHQPSGTCNFSRIDNATLQLVLSNATVGGTATAKVRVYATNYNVLRIMSGMGGLAYSN